MLVQVRRADRQPAIVDDPDLRVNIDRLRPVRCPRVEGARQETAGPAICLHEHPDLTVTFIVAAVGMRGQNDHDPELVARRVPKLRGENLDELG